MLIGRSINTIEQPPGPQLPPSMQDGSTVQHVNVDLEKLGMEDKLRDVFRF